ncbi:hypothetical protein H8S20_03565 [Clostridium sp. NSJ-6]|uniref:Uncharacterized protein n=1 Tax=Clostridium hominis TaxID=2763036 RepID=A0ABR7D9Z1_9CLOT|nr:hypothetical protein [Clostridium hominis]MBC5627965.1 hypothetical protein [Clostridium hominis]MDU2672726.1 hypothetical protein [Clostridium sp.]
MYISMPRDFFVPVMYDYKENLNLIDEESQEMYRESKGQINAEYQKALQEKEAIYVKPGSKETTGEEKVNEEYYKALQEKEATYVKPGSKDISGEGKVNEEYYKALQEKEATYVRPNMYVSIDDEYINNATSKQNRGINKGGTRENYNGPINRRMYSDLDDEYARGFKR